MVLPCDEMLFGRDDLFQQIILLMFLGPMKRHDRLDVHVQLTFRSRFGQFHQKLDGQLVPLTGCGSRGSCRRRGVG